MLQNSKIDILNQFGFDGEGVALQPKRTTVLERWVVSLSNYQKRITVLSLSELSVTLMFCYHDMAWSLALMFCYQDLSCFLHTIFLEMGFRQKCYSLKASIWNYTQIQEPHVKLEYLLLSQSWPLSWKQMQATCEISMPMMTANYQHTG